MNQDSLFEERMNRIRQEQEELLSRKNEPLFSTNGIFNRYRYPILTRDHFPMEWRFDMDPATNPWFMERIGFNAAFNSGAILWKGRYLLAVRCEGNDRKSFFAIAESPNGVDNFRFWERPLSLPETEDPDTNVYDMRLTAHEDGFLYGVFCTERKDPYAPEGDTSSAVAAAGIARTTDLLEWERLPDLVTYGGQQRNVVLHPEFIDGKYAFFTRPQDGFIETGKGGGIAFGLSGSIEGAEVKEERIMDAKTYHTIYELKNGIGTDQNRKGMAQPGPRGSQLCSRAEVHPLSVHDRGGRSFPGDPQAGGPFHGTPERGAGGRCFQCALLQWVDRRHKG
jgi:4-O-beta-D-mannosyl-D-glucose phosphorylase